MVIITEIASPSPLSRPSCDGFNGYTMGDTSQPIPSRYGRLVQLGTTMWTAGSWRPKLFRALTPAQGGAYCCIYNHPVMVAHSGSGMEYADLIGPVHPNGFGPIFVGGYFTAFSAGTGLFAQGRIESAGDIAIGSCTMKDGATDIRENGWETPAMGMRFFGAPNTEPVIYKSCFAQGADGWQSNGTESISGGTMLVTIVPLNDHNHDPSIGTLSLLINHNAESVAPFYIGGINGLLSAYPSQCVVTPANMSGAVITMRYRGIGVNLRQCKWRHWLQARIVDVLGKNTNTFANFVLNTTDWGPDLLDGQWHERSLMWPTAPASWTLAYSSPSETQYQTWDLPNAITHVCNIHFPFVAPVGSPDPSGQVQFSNITISYPNGW